MAILELRILRYFLAVAEAGSVSRAAADLRIAQPSLSRQLRGLEAELRVGLFHRGATGVRLTAAGARLLPMAQDLVARAEVAEAQMRASADGARIRLQVVAPATTVADVIAPFLAASGPEAPFVTARELLPAAVFSSLERGDADLAISSGPPPAGFASRPIFRFGVWAYVPPRHRWARRRTGRVRVRELAQEPLIVLGPDHGTRRLLDTAMAEAGLAYRTALETNVPEIAQALAASDHGVAVVSDDPRYDLRPLMIVGPGGPLRISLVAAWDATHYAADTIELWVDQLAAYCVERYAGGRVVAAGRKAQALPDTAMTSISTTMSR
jgi:DNA-binding transcriptional LysR family regulator